MALESLTSNELLNFIIYDTISATPISYQNCSLETTSFRMENNYVLKPQDPNSALDGCCLTNHKRQHADSLEGSKRKQNLGAQGRKKRRRKPRICKNKEEAEAQRMTHIAVERNRRKQMNNYLAVLRSSMPESYVQRGDQASIVGGAIQFVKELEHLLQSLEVQKLQLVGFKGTNQEENMMDSSKFLTSPFSQFFAHPQYGWSLPSNKHTAKTQAAMADIEVTLIETHANIRILTRRRPKQLVELVTGLQTLKFTILHLNVTTMDPLVLYSANVKVEEGCLLTSVDDIASAVHQMLRIIDEEAGVAAAVALC